MHRSVDHEQAIRDAFDGYAARFRRSASRENRARLMEIVEKLEQERRGYLRIAVQGYVGDEELTGMLMEIDAKKRRTEQELVAARDATLAAEIESLQDMLIDGARRGYWRPGHTPEERHELYKRLMLRVEVERDGSLQLSGTFGEALNGCVSDTILTVEC